MTVFGVDLERCPKAWIESQPNDLLDTIADVQRFIRTGIMPFSGGWMDQHPHWIDVEEIVSGVMMERDVKGDTKR